jgi:hypothetical protein
MKYTKIVLTILDIILANIPIYIGLIAYWLLGPITFWEKLISIVVAVAVLGGPQICVWIMAAGFLAFLWED